MKTIDWRYGIGLTILIFGLVIMIIPPLSLVMVIAGAILIGFSKKSLRTKALTIAICVILWVLAITN